MNAVFSILVIASIVYMLILSPSTILATMLEGSGRAVYFSLTLFSVYVVWLTVLKILEKAKADLAIGKLLKRPIRLLFPKEEDRAYSELSINLSANLLGMGGAATPAGLKAMESMKSRKNRIMLVVINSTSIQLIPTTIIGIRAGYGAVSDIVLPSLIATFCTTAISVIMVKLLVRE